MRIAIAQADVALLCARVVPVPRGLWPAIVDRDQRHRNKVDVVQLVRRRDVDEHTQSVVVACRGLDEDDDARVARLQEPGDVIDESTRRQAASAAVETVLATLGTAAVLRGEMPVWPDYTMGNIKN